MADDNEVQIAVMLALDQANQNLSTLNQTLSQFAGQAGKFFDGASASWASFVGNLAAEAVEEAFHLVTEAATEFYEVFIVQGVEAAQKEQDSLAQLDTALAANGLLTRQNTQDLKAFTQAMEDYSGNSKAVINSSMATLESMGQLDEQGLKRATKDAIDLSAALHIDLDTAIRMISRSSDDNTASLKKAGITYKQTGDTAKDFNAVLGQIEQRYGGAAGAQMQTFSGSLKGMQNAFEDLQASIGKFITQNPLVIYGIDLAKQAFQEMETWVNQNKATVLEFVNNGLIFMIQAFSVLLTTGDGIVRFFTGLTDGMELLIDEAVYPTIYALAELGVGFIKVIQLAPGMHTAFDGMKNDLQGLADSSLKQVDDDAQKTFNDFTQEGAMGKAADGVDQMVAKLKTFAATNKTLSDGIVATNNANTKKQTDYEKLSDQQRLDNLKTTLGTVASLTKTTNVELFRVGQAAAVAQATVDGFAAIQKALASAPPPFNFALAALVGVAEASNIANIVSTAPPSFATGGIVPGNSTSGDNVAANVNSREMILTMNDQANLLDSIQSGSIGSGGGTNVFQIGTVIGTQDWVDNYLMPYLRQAMQARNLTLPAKGIV